MTTTPEARRSAAHILTGLFGVAPLTTMSPPILRQAAGYGYVGVSLSAPVASTGEVFPFVYRPIRRKLRARKRRFN